MQQHCHVRISRRLRNDLYCVEWGVKLYSLTPKDLSAYVGRDYT